MNTISANKPVSFGQLTSNVLKPSQPVGFASTTTGINAQEKLPVPMASTVLAQQPKFSGLTDEKYSVTLRWNNPLDADVASSVFRSLQVQDMLMTTQEDNTNLQLNLDLIMNGGYPLVEEAALADSFHLLSRPVDVIVKSVISGSGLKTLQMATGKRLMHDRAEINTGTLVFPNGPTRNSEAQMNNELNEEYLRDLEQVLMDRVGISRKQANEALNSDKEFNPLQALYYGRKGLVDGVITGYDQVITRKDLKDYLKANKDTLDTQKKVQDFLKLSTNIDLIPSRSLAEFSASTAGLQVEESEPNRPPLYQSIKAMIEDAGMGPDSPLQAVVIQELDQMEADAEQQVVEYVKEWATDVGQEGAAEEFLTQLAEASAKADEENKAQLPLTLYKMAPDGKGVAKIPGDKLPLNMTVKPLEITPTRTEFDNLPENRSILQDDVIYFNDGFTDETAEQITSALKMLDAKKSQQENPSNIKIVVNSPGGVLWSAMDINSTIRRLKTPVDIIVNGFAASCGSILLSVDRPLGKNGNRFVTPGAKVMLHEASAFSGHGTGNDDRSFAEYMNNVTESVVSIIAKRAGRPLDKAMKEMEKDVWVNPIEAFFYGKNGLIDGILVGDKVITKDEVYNLMLEQTGLSKRELNKVIRDRIDSLGSVRQANTFKNHDENDPFENAHKVILELAKTAKPLSEVEAFADSVPRNNGETIEQIVVKTQPDIFKMLGLGEAQGSGLEPIEVLAKAIKGQSKQG